jgi:hypothetical protein
LADTEFLTVREAAMRPVTWLAGVGLWLYCIWIEMSNSTSLAEIINNYGWRAGIALAIGALAAWLVIRFAIGDPKAAFTIIAPTVCWLLAGVVAAELFFVAFDDSFDKAVVFRPMIAGFGAASGAAYGMLSLWRRGEFPQSIKVASVYGVLAATITFAAGESFDLLRFHHGVDSEEAGIVAVLAVILAIAGAAGGALSAVATRRWKERYPQR